MISIDNTLYQYNNEVSTIYQLCQSKNIVLPCFCYHERLTIAGNCRMCLVEVNGALAVSCAVPVVDNMNIVTTSQRLLHAREAVLEFLLVNHPLDCPICDQGGECDLQDITLVFGLDRGRFYQNKRSVDNLNCFGVLIKTIMTRCIHCTRCVRFLSEYTDTMDLGVIGRGNSMEIGTYIEKAIDHELSGNIIDLCPVGALTSMPYSFSARPWELNSVESIDVLDAMGSSIRVDVANNTVIRIIPTLMESINEDWITNKTRYAFDSLNIQRILTPKIRIHGQLVNCNWATALELVSNKLFTGEWYNVQAICGNYIDLSIASYAKKFFNSFGCNNIVYQYNGEYTPSDWQCNFLLNYSMEQIETFDIVILINTNLRVENPLLNSRLRKNYLNNKSVVYSFGNALTYSTYPVINIGNSLKSLMLFLQGKYYYFNKLFFHSFFNLSYINSQNFANHNSLGVIIGQQVLFRPDAKLVTDCLSKFSYKLHRYYRNNKPIYGSCVNYLGYISCAELALYNYNNKKANSVIGRSFNYHLGTEYIPVKHNGDFVVYQGYQLPDNHKEIDIFLPTTTYHETVHTFMNLQGRIRSTKVALASPSTVLPAKEILQLLYAIKTRSYSSNLSVIENFYQIMSFNKDVRYDVFNNAYAAFKSDLLTRGTIQMPWALYWNAVYGHNHNLLKIYIKKIMKNTIFDRNISNYYTSDLSSRYSKNMSTTASKVIITSFANKINVTKQPWE